MDPRYPSWQGSLVLVGSSHNGPEVAHKHSVSGIRYPGIQYGTYSYGLWLLPNEGYPPDLDGKSMAGYPLL